MTKESYIDKGIQWVRKKAHLSIQANNIEGYEKPKAFTNQRTSDVVCPDISFEGPRGSKNYTEIAVKEPDYRKVVTRWKLLSSLAEVKNGKLYILAPRGHRSFAQNLVDSYSIKASVYSI